MQVRTAPLTVHLLQFDLNPVEAVPPIVTDAVQLAHKPVLVPVVIKTYPAWQAEASGLTAKVHVAA